MPNKADMLNLRGRFPRTIQAGEVCSDGYIRVELPSRTGYLEFGEMTGHEENLFAKKNLNPFAPFYETLSRITRGLPTNEKDKLDQVRTMMDDFTFALFMIRRGSMGDIFKFDIPCPACEKTFEWQQDLAEMEVLYASDEVADQLKAGAHSHFEFTTPRKQQKIRYRLPVADDQNKLYRLRQSAKDNLYTEALRLCVLEIDGKPASQNVWAGMSAADLKFFEQELTSRSFGVQRSFQPFCLFCDHTWEMELPIDSPDFFIRPKMAMRPDGTFSTLWGSPGA